MRCPDAAAKATQAAAPEAAKAATAATRRIARMLRTTVPPRGLPAGPPLPIYAHIMLARPRTLPTGFIAPCPDKLPSGSQIAA